MVQRFIEPTRSNCTTKPSLLDLIITSEYTEISRVEIPSALGRSDQSFKPMLKSLGKTDCGRISSYQRYRNLREILSIALLGQETDKKAQKLYKKDIINQIKHNLRNLAVCRAKMKT